MSYELRVEFSQESESEIEIEIRLSVKFLRHFEILKFALASIHNADRSNILSEIPTYPATYSITYSSTYSAFYSATYSALYSSI